MPPLTVVSLPVKPIITIPRNIWLALWLTFSCCCSNQTRHESRRLGISGLIDISGNVTDRIHRRAAIHDTPIIRNISLTPHPFLWREFTSAQRWSRFHASVAWSDPDGEVPVRLMIELQVHFSWATVQWQPSLSAAYACASSALMNLQYSSGGANDRWPVRLAAHHHVRPSHKCHCDRVRQPVFPDIFWTRRSRSVVRALEEVPEGDEYQGWRSTRQVDDHDTMPTHRSQHVGLEFVLVQTPELLCAG